MNDIFEFQTGWYMCNKTHKLRRIFRSECNKCPDFDRCKPAFGPSPLAIGIPDLKEESAST